MYVCMYAYMYVCIHTCMYACMYICMHVCMYVYIRVCIYIRACILVLSKFVFEYTATYIKGPLRDMEEKVGI